MKRKEKYAIRMNYAINKLGGKCIKCGKTKSLTFDHINNDRNGQRKRLISQLVMGRLDNLDNELKLCQILCRSCHGFKSNNERDWGEIIKNRKPREYVHIARHGTSSEYNNHGCRCELCRAAWTAYVANRRSRVRME